MGGLRKGEESRMTTSASALQLVGVKTSFLKKDGQTMEKSMEVPQKTKNRTTVRPSNPTTGPIP